MLCKPSRRFFNEVSPTRIAYRIRFGGIVPYIGGEIPKMGDRVKDANSQLATVVELGRNNHVIVKWDEGVVGIEYPAQEFTLIARALKHDALR